MYQEVILLYIAFLLSFNLNILEGCRLKSEYSYSDEKVNYISILYEIKIDARFFFFSLPARSFFD